jgi:hypothetical protein
VKGETGIANTAITDMKNTLTSQPGRCCFFIFIIFLMSRLPLNASLTFDWPATPGWTAGTPSAGQTKTQDFTSVNPNDITVSVNNSGTGALGMNFQGGYPQISSNPFTGGFSGVNGLELLATSSQAIGTYAKVTVSFATPVTNLSFQIWDVDAVPGQFVDKIANIQALAQGGATVGADSVNSAVAGYNTVVGTGLATVVLGTANANNGTNQGTINLTFNGPITQFSFEWSNNDPALGQQGIALGPLTYTPVPEIAPPWSAAGACSMVIVFEFLRRRRSKRYR